MANASMMSRVPLLWIAPFRSESCNGGVLWVAASNTGAGGGGGCNGWWAGAFPVGTSLRLNGVGVADGTGVGVARGAGVANASVKLSARAYVWGPCKP